MGVRGSVQAQDGSRENRVEWLQRDREMLPSNAWLDHYAALLRTVRRPARPQHEELREMVSACETGVDAWETFAANGVIPMAWLADERRWFVARPSARRRAKHRHSNVFSTEIAAVNAGAKMHASCVPADKELAIALAASAASLVAAEDLAREVVVRSSMFHEPWRSRASRSRRVLWNFWRRERRASLSSRTAKWLQMLSRMWVFSRASDATIEGLPEELVARVSAVYSRSDLPDQRALIARLVAASVSQRDADSVSTWAVASQRWSDVLEALSPFAEGRDAVRWTATYARPSPRSIAMSVTREQLVNPFEPLLSLWSLGFTLLSEGDDWVYLGVPRFTPAER